MIIKDDKDQLLAIILKPSEVKEKKFFATSNDNELQLASFQLDAGEEIIRHYHPRKN
jgi:quercetin dioxygenase-like cupin family protein